MEEVGSKGNDHYLSSHPPHQGTLFAARLWAALSTDLQSDELLIPAGTNSVTCTLFSRRKMRKVYGRAAVNLLGQ